MRRNFPTVVPIVSACVLLASACTSADSPPSGQAPSPLGTRIEIQMLDGAPAIRMDATRAPTVLLGASPEQVWGAIPAVYAALEIPAEIAEPAAFTYGTTRFTRSRLGGDRITRFLRCGSQGSGSGALPVTAYRVRLSVISSVEPGTTAGTARLTTRVQGSATSVEGTGSAMVGCSSTGELEQRIHALLLERLAG